MYISWDEFFMGIADLASQRSKDPKTKVGCVIVEPENKTISAIGYNGLPRGMEDTEEIWGDNYKGSFSKHDFVVHAEANAILNATRPIKDNIVYVTMFPCNDCAKLLAQTGVSEIVYRDEKYLNKHEGMAAKEIFNAVGIKIRKY